MRAANAVDLHSSPQDAVDLHSSSVGRDSSHIRSTGCTSKRSRSGISSNNNSSGLQCFTNPAAEWTRGVCVHTEPRHYTMISDRRLQQPIS